MILPAAHSSGHNDPVLSLDCAKKLTQILVSSPDEAAAAEEANIDLILAKPDENVRKNAHEYSTKLMLELDSRENEVDKEYERYLKSKK